MTSDISSRSRMRRKSHVRFCRRVERSDPLGLVIGAKSHKRVLICLLNSILNGKPHINDITLDPNEYKKHLPTENLYGLILQQRLTMARFLISRFNAKTREILETEPRFISRNYERAS